MAENTVPVRPEVKPEVLLKYLMQGAPLLVGEYRGTKIDKVDYTDSQTGKPASFLKVTHSVEVEDAKGQVEHLDVSERQPKEVDSPDKVVIGLRKGQRVALRLQGLQRVKGRLEASIGDDKSSIAILV